MMKDKNLMVYVLCLHDHLDIVDSEGVKEFAVTTTTSPAIL